MSARPSTTEDSILFAQSWRRPSKERMLPPSAPVLSTPGCPSSLPMTSPMTLSSGAANAAISSTPEDQRFYHVPSNLDADVSKCVLPATQHHRKQDLCSLHGLLNVLLLTFSKSDNGRVDKLHSFGLGDCQSSDLFFCLQWLWLHPT